MLLLFAGSPLRAQRIEPKAADALRVMSYNVRNGRGLDEVTDYRRVSDAISRAAPDVVAVQELDSVTERYPVFVLKELADRTGMYPVYGPAIDYQGGKYGVGILSRTKPLSWRTVPLPGREEPRVLLIAEFDGYLLCCTHFSLTAEDRNATADIIKRELGGVAKPLFLAGDMNSKYDSPVQRSLREKFVLLSDPARNTFPAVNPRQCIDYIYGLDNGSRYTVLQRVVMDEPDASDHLPLFIDVKVE